MRTLAVDIGGSGIKALVLDPQGNPVTKRLRLSTPQPAPPALVLELIAELAGQLGDFERIAVGFPGVVQQGRVMTAHLDPEWIGFALDTALAKRLGKPTRAANDADVQGFGTIGGQGLELVITLGTGFGSALFNQGQLIPNLELAHHLFYKGKTYEERLGNAALKRHGADKWNTDLVLAINALKKLFNFDYAYIGGGNSKHVTIVLPENIHITSNENGLLGGIALWRTE